MILYEAIDIKVGSTNVSEIYLGRDLVWSSESEPEAIWSFNDPASGDNINLAGTFIGRVTAHWGDGNSNTLVSDAAQITHNYT
jgi:hypothetical protein